MTIQRRQFLRTAGLGTLAGLAGCTGTSDPSQGGASSESPSPEPSRTDRGSRSESAGDAGGGQIGDGELVLATTTSTYDTGLLDAVHPPFEEQTGLRIKTIPKGTGASIRTARDGDADVILVHARGAEDEFLQDGYGVNRRDVMFNDFVIVGSPSDPAGIKGMESATEAFDTIAESQEPFVSRGDDSGTNKKELNVWDEAGIDPSGTWYREVGKGMGDTLVQTDQTPGAYTIADRGTFLAMQNAIDLEILVQGPLQGGPVILKNPYGVIAVNPAIYDDVNYQAAMAYIGFLTSPQGQSLIADYTANGSQLFYPNALAEEPDFAQYVPEGYSVEAAAKLTPPDKRYLSWVDQQAPGDYGSRSL